MPPKESSNNADQANAQFWDELCGTSLAQNLGIRDHSPGSLALFDEAYLDFYPYLLDRVDVSRLAARKVLEVGLGYGTLGQKIAEAGAEYTGLDVAEGPVLMMRKRLKMKGLPGECIQGSALDIPLPSGTQDFVISIGCFHHTGNIQRTFEEAHRVLKPDGVAVIMVYNQFSYYQWLRFPRETYLALCCELRLRSGSVRVTEQQRGHYDRNSRGQEAPETVLSSIASLRRMLVDFRSVTFRKENNTALGLPRKWLLPYLGRLCGLDIYIEAQK